MCRIPLSTQKFENLAEENAVPLSESNICGIPKWLKIYFNFRVMWLIWKNSGLLL